MDNYYELLEISHTASEEVIRAAYKAKVKIWHPDNFSGDKEKEKATRMLQVLNEALETLTDTKKRNHYDDGIKGRTTNHKNEKDFQSHSTTVEEKEEILDLVQKMIVLTRNEEEYLQLHRQIRQSDYSDHEKMLMEEALDYITSMRLEEDIKQADSLAYCKKEVSDHKSGIVWWIVIGFVLTKWIASAWWIAIVLSIISYIGGSDDRQALKQAEQAELRIRQYRMNGFRI